jgi:Flp pilus assembly protein protease CpaA
MTLVSPQVLSWTVVTAGAALTTAAAMHDVIARTIPNRWCAAIAFAGVGIRVLDHTLLGGLAAGAAVSRCLRIWFPHW